MLFMRGDETILIKLLTYITISTGVVLYHILWIQQISQGSIYRVPLGRLDCTPYQRALNLRLVPVKPLVHVDRPVARRPRQLLGQRLVLHQKLQPRLDVVCSPPLGLCFCLFFS